MTLVFRSDYSILIMAAPFLSQCIAVHVNLRVILDPPEHPKEHLPTTDPFP